MCLVSTQGYNSICVCMCCMADQRNTQSDLLHKCHHLEPLGDVLYNPIHRQDNYNPDACTITAGWIRFANKTEPIILDIIRSAFNSSTDIWTKYKVHSNNMTTFFSILIHIHLLPIIWISGFQNYLKLIVCIFRMGVIALINRFDYFGKEPSDAYKLYNLHCTNLSLAGAVF